MSQIISKPFRHQLKRKWIFKSTFVENALTKDTKRRRQRTNAVALPSAYDRIPENFVEIKKLFTKIYFFFKSYNFSSNIRGGRIFFQILREHSHWLDFYFQKCVAVH